MRQLWPPRRTRGTERTPRNHSRGVTGENEPGTPAPHRKAQCCSFSPALYCPSGWRPEGGSPAALVKWGSGALICGTSRALETRVLSPAPASPRNPLRSFALRPCPQAPRPSLIGSRPAEVPRKATPPRSPATPVGSAPSFSFSGLQGPEGSLQARLSLVPYQPSPAPYVTSVQRRRGRRKCARPGSREARLRCHSLASGGSSGSGLGDSEADGESERGRRNEAAAGPGRAWRLTAPRRPPSHLLQAAARTPQGLALRGPLGSSDRGSRAPDPTL